MTYPWVDDKHAFTGIPPHAYIIQDLTRIRSDQENLIKDFVGKVKEALDIYSIDTARLTEGQLRKVLDDFSSTCQVQFESWRKVANGDSTLLLLEIETSSEKAKSDGWELHTYGCMLHRLPADYLPPRCGCRYL